MPTYQYACTECGHDFETVQSFSDDALSACPVCGGRLRKIFNSVGIVFKGSGFYRNDSREKAKTGAEGTDNKSDSDAKSGAKADLKPDAKPAGKTDAASSTTKSGDSSTSGGGAKKKGASSTTGSAA